MKGVYYNRHGDYGNDRTDDWHQPVEGGSVVVSLSSFTSFFPEVVIQGEAKHPGQSVKITFGRGKEWVASHSDDWYPPNLLGEFKFEWSGQDVTEHWFDNEAICLKLTRDYVSGTGLTAEAIRLVVYKRHAEVNSFRGWDRVTHPAPGKIWAEFVNRPTDYRANWTGFAIGSLEHDGTFATVDGWTYPVPVVGELDMVIEKMLSGNPGQPTVCKHNNLVQAHVAVSDPVKLPLHLCKSCRMRGVRWEEFAVRNRADTCPYFRRACKSVVEKSDPFPGWFSWNRGGLLSSTLRMQDGENAVYEVVYVTQRDGFIRRAILLLNNRVNGAWTFRYNGFVPRTIAEFKAKYADGRAVDGYPPEREAKEQDAASAEGLKPVEVPSVVFALEEAEADEIDLAAVLGGGRRQALPPTE